MFRRTAPHGGDWSTVNVGPVFAPKPFEQHSLPGYRQIVDLSPANDSRFLEAVGQSGNVFSPHYDDALPDWSAGRYRKMRIERERDRARRDRTPAARSTIGRHTLFTDTKITKTAARAFVLRLR